MDIFSYFFILFSDKIFLNIRLTEQMKTNVVAIKLKHSLTDKPCFQIVSRSYVVKVRRELNVVDISS